jgi:hypothetical protein
MRIAGLIILCLWTAPIIAALLVGISCIVSSVFRQKVAVWLLG